MATGHQKIEALVDKWFGKTDLTADAAIRGAVRETIAECSAIVDSCRSSGDNDLRTVREVVGAFERWNENPDD